MNLCLIEIRSCFLYRYRFTIQIFRVMYVGQLWDFFKKDVNILTMWCKSKRHLLNLPQRTHDRLCPQIVDEKPFEV